MSLTLKRGRTVQTPVPAAQPRQEGGEIGFADHLKIAGRILLAAMAIVAATAVIIWLALVL